MAHESRNHKLDERGRLTAFCSVWRFLSDEDQQLALDGELHEDALKSAYYDKSPIARGTNFICNSEVLLRRFGNTSKPAIRQHCQKWFLEMATSTSRSSFADMKRATKGDWRLSQEDFDKLAGLLVEVHFEDASGNMRRFDSLENMLQFCTDIAEGKLEASPEQKVVARRRANVILEIKSKAGGKAATNLDVVRRRLQRKCQCGSSTCSHPLHACARHAPGARVASPACMHAMHAARDAHNVPCVLAASSCAKSASRSHARVRRRTSVRGASVASSPSWSTSSAKSISARTYRDTAQT